MVKSLKTESRMEVPNRLGAGRAGSCYLIGTEFQICKICGNGDVMVTHQCECDLIPLHCTLKSSQDGKFYISSILTHFFHISN